MTSSVGWAPPTKKRVGQVLAPAVTILMFVTVAHQARANSPNPQQTLTNALNAFDNGTNLMRTDPEKAQHAFSNAAQNFQSLINDGHKNAPLYYNLANTHLRLGQTGQAIANYRRALKINPADERVKANLNFARTLTHDRFEATGTDALKQTLLFWHYETPAKTRLNIAIILYAAFWLILITKTFIPKLRINWPAAVTGTLALALTVSLSISIPNQSRLTGGVITANEVIVRKGNGQSYAPQFDQPLHEGVEFTLLEKRNNWAHIKLPDNNKGWIQTKDTELF